MSNSELFPANVEVGDAPIKEQFTENSRWTTHLADVSDAIKGDWGLVSKNAFTITAENSSFKVTGRELGTMAVLRIEISDYAAGSNSSISWSNSFKMDADDGILECFALESGNWINKNGCFVSGKVIQLPEFTADKIFIQGFITRRL